MSSTINNVLQWWSEERSEQLAVVHSGDSLTYGELNAWVGRVAAYFVAAGLQVGERVCIFAPNSLAWWVSVLATFRAGGVAAGLNTRLAPSEAHYLLSDYAPKLLVGVRESAQAAFDIGALDAIPGVVPPRPELVTIGKINSMRAGHKADVCVDVDPDAPAVIVTTSGSTARPKGVIYTNRSMIESSWSLVIEDPLLVQPLRQFILAPFSTSAGTVQLTHALLQGGTSYFESDAEPERVLEVVVNERITMLTGAPIFFQRIADSPSFASADISSIQVAITGGAAVPVSLLKRWADKGVLLRQMFGQTEAGGWGITNPPRYALTHADRCGKGGPTRQVAIIDSEGRFVSAGQSGQIVMRGSGVMLGYWNNPTATSETLVDGWLRTGDIGVIDELGLLKFLDRAKDMIISGGLNISAAEVERVILEYPGIAEVAVVSAPDEKFGETPMAIIYGAAGISISDLLTHCCRHLSAFKVPRYVVVHEAPLPRLATGKISKPALRETHLSGQSLPARVR